MAALLRFAAALGPLTVCAILLWGFLAVREAWRGWFADAEKIGGAGTFLVDEIKAVSKLKVLRVFDAGLDTYPAVDEKGSREKGYVDYQYSGVIDLYVDLTKSVIRTNGVNGFIVELAGIEYSPVREISLNRGLNIDVDEKISVEEYRKFYGNPNRQTELLNSLPKFQAASVIKTSQSNEYVDRAKNQAERMLRYLFKPLVEDPEKDVVVRWGSLGTVPSP